MPEGPSSRFLRGIWPSAAAVVLTVAVLLPIGPPVWADTDPPADITFTAEARADGFGRAGG